MQKQELNAAIVGTDETINFTDGQDSIALYLQGFRILVTFTDLTNASFK